MPTTPPASAVSIRVPLLKGLAVLLFAVATSQLILWGIGRMTDREVARLGRVYLDGLAAVLPLILNGISVSLKAALNRTLGFQKGIPEHQIVIRTPEGRHHASAGGGPEVDWPALFLRNRPHDTVEISTDGDAVWGQQALGGRGRRMAYLAAQLDVSRIAKRRRRLREALIGFSLLLAVFGGEYAPSPFGVPCSPYSW